MDDIKIIGFSGRRSSGKNTCGNFLYGLEMVRGGILENGFSINEKGQLEVNDLFGDTNAAGVFDQYRNTPEMTEFLATHLSPFVRMYSFADLLKREVCIKIFGLSHEQCFGTDDQKKSLTKLKWEDMPGVTTLKTPTDPISKDVAGRLGEYYEKALNGLVYHQPGLMTAREVLQFVGTEIFRKMYANVWAEATVRTIQNDNPLMAIVTDVRFPNEVEAIQAAGGKVIRLDKVVFTEDVHESELCLDRDKFDWKKFDYVCENQNLNIGEQNADVYNKLREWGYYNSEITKS